MKKHLIMIVIAGAIALSTVVTEVKSETLVENAYREFNKEQARKWNFTMLPFKGRVVPLIEGHFYEFPIVANGVGGGIAWFVAGQFHHIASMDTYLGLFTNPDQYYYRISYSEFQTMINTYGTSLTGATLLPDNGIINYNNNLYFRIKDRIFYIHSPGEFSGYHLSDAVIQNVSNIWSYNPHPNGFGQNMIWPYF
jgi:hypothetical protein